MGWPAALVCDSPPCVDWVLVGLALGARFTYYRVRKLITYAISARWGMLTPDADAGRADVFLGMYGGRVGRLCAHGAPGRRR